MTEMKRSAIEVVSWHSADNGVIELTESKQSEDEVRFKTAILSNLFVLDNSRICP